MNFDQRYNDFALISQSPLPTWLKLAVCVLVLGMVAISARAYLRAGRRYLPLVVLNALAALAIVTVFVEPALDLREVDRTPARVAIIIDDSQSMAEKRLGQVQAWLDANAANLAAQNGGQAPEFYSLHGAGRPSAAEADRSDLQEGLIRALDTSSSGRPLASVVLFSDGADTTALGRAKDEDERAQKLSNLARFGVPVSTVTLGDASASDLFIDDVVEDKIAFVRNTVKVEVRIGAHGFANARVPIKLYRDGAPMLEKSVVIENGHADALFEFVPDTVAEHVMAVEVAPQPGEATLSNNRREFVLRVIRDKIRVLLVAGRPAWDERFLRKTLKNSPNIDLISFFILRTPADLQLVPQSESSLIPFPTQELFDTELHTFDVVILQNFDYRPYNMAYLLKNLREHVNQGGALVMFGGEGGFGGGAYGQTPLADVLPVEMGVADTDMGAFKPKVTDAGQKHPMLRIASGSQPREQAIERLPPLLGINKVSALAPNASALLVHPELKMANGAPMPLLAVREVGRGRTAAIMSDSLWRWSYTDKMQGNTGASYDRFVSQMLRWLMRDPDVTRVRVRSAKEHVRVGEKTELSVHVLGPDYQPQANVFVSLTLHEDKAQVFEGQTNAEGVFAMPYTPKQGGVVRVVGEAKLDDDVSERATLLLYVDEGDAERAASAPREDVMQSIAQATGGVAQSFDSVDPSAWPKKDAEMTRLLRHEEVSLWNTWAALILVAAALSAEWFLRRRRGFS